MLSYHKTGKIATLPVAFFRSDLYSIIDGEEVHGFSVFFSPDSKIFFNMAAIVHTFVIAACYTFRERKVSFEYCYCSQL